MMPRIIAIDWSGAKIGAARKIWLAEARDGVLLRLEGGWRREAIIEHLAETAREGGPVVAGLDFGFSFPAWYLRERGFAAAHDAWSWLARDGCADALLAACAEPFWGLTGKRRTGAPQYRRTEEAVAAAEGVRPTSVFQVGGAGAVGTGSLRGMCALHELRAAGYAIWPFDAPGPATAVEIYPRLMRARGVVKSRRDQRAQHVAADGGIPARLAGAVIASDDAFDAATSAITMSLHARELARLPVIDDLVLRLEGIIWWPRWQRAHGMPES
jgi:hypothetical protein